MSEPLDLDPHFVEYYKALKSKREYSWIALQIEGKMLKVTHLEKGDKDVNTLLDFLKDKKCLYVVYQHHTKSDDGFLKIEKIFLLTYVNTIDRSVANVYNLDVTKRNLVKECIGAIEIAASTPPEVKKKMYGIEKIRRQTVFGDEKEIEEDKEGDDWMDF